MKTFGRAVSSFVGYYVKTVGINCNQCRSRVGIAVLGKLCVRFGSAVRQFCSSPCLEKFKLNHRLCAQCQVNMPNKDQVSAPVFFKPIPRSSIGEI